MSSELLVAVLVAGFLGVFSLPTGYLHCWWSWSWRLSLTALITHIAVVGVFGGLVGWGTAHALKEPDFGLESWFFVGVIYGLIGSVVVLADVKTLRFGESSGSNAASSAAAGLPEPPAELKEAASIVGSSARFWTKTLDKHCASRANKWLEDLDRGTLVEQAAWLRAELAVGDLAAGARRELIALIDAVGDGVETGDLAARASLIAFGRRIILSLHLERPRSPARPIRHPSRRKSRR